MEAEVKDGNLVIKMPVNQNPPMSKSGKTRIAAGTNGFIKIKSDDGKEYSLSLNLIRK